MEYLADVFLSRVQRAYRLALKEGATAEGRMWRRNDALRKDIHAALIADDLDSLREIFRNPLSTYLYYGTDNLCRGFWNDGPTDFLSAAFAPGSRASWGEYQAKRVCDVLSSIGGTSVVEIGPGVGHTIYYTFRSGVTDYTTVDLPLGMVGQACFLGAMLGPDKLWFDGESPADAAGCVKLFCNNAKLPQKFDIALNADSITEMSVSAALAYAEWINDHARVFISINHEMNPFTVGELAGLKFAITSSTRTPWSFRRGWFEETFWLANTGAPAESSLLLRMIAAYRRGRTILHRRLGLPSARAMPALTANQFSITIGGIGV